MLAHHTLFMKKVILLQILAFYCLATMAQNTNVTFEFGPVKQYSSKINISYFEPFGNDGTSTFGVIGGIKKSQIANVGKDLTISTFERFVLEQEHMKQEHEQFLYLNGKIYYFVSFKNKKTDKVHLVYQEINKTTLKPEAEVKQLISVDYSRVKKYNNTQFFFELSPDSSKLLVSHRIVKNNATFSDYGFDVFDNTLQYLWSFGNASQLVANAKILRQSWAISNSGEAYVLSKQQEDGKDAYSFTLLKIEKMGAGQKAYPLLVKDHFIRTMGIACNNNNEVVCAGAYSDFGNRKLVGACSFILENKPDATLKIHEALSEKKFAADEIEDHNYVPAEVVFDGAGNFMFTAEQQKTVFVREESPTSINGYYKFYNENIYFAGFLADGTVAWQNKITKKQETNEALKSWASYKAFVMNDKFYIFYNIMPGTWSNFVKMKEITTVLLSYDLNGKETFEKFTGFQESNSVAMSRHAIKLDNKTMLVCANNFATYSFVKMVFP